MCFPHPTNIMLNKRLSSGTQKACRRIKQLIGEKKNPEDLHRGTKKAAWIYIESRQ